jgi:hypothetical protein
MKHTLEIDSHAELHAAAPGSRTGEGSGRVLGINWQTEIGVFGELERVPVKMELEPPGAQGVQIRAKVAAGRPG